MRLSSAVMYTPDPTTDQETQNNRKTRGETTPPSQFASHVLTSQLPESTGRKEHSPQILFADATIISALASNFAEYRSASVGCNWLFCDFRGFT